MTCKGHIKNGSVVLDEPVALPDGAEVTVDLVPANPPVPLAELLTADHHFTQAGFQAILAASGT